MLFGALRVSMALESSLGLSGPPQVFATERCDYHTWTMAPAEASARAQRATNTSGRDVSLHPMLHA
eukprot:13137190-Alexandrium_andersonii.AAC.1